ncbi:LOW QUALITY PROTEIN: uncharacterized protein C3orf38 homolog [Rhagoletis pomonella]|uniref:LOW QUALITY PROTEIN: uncharacterized protein C3orf38 homolog n=1 Tax=Rhagoletis pomonella TaxID=28610 RepID=UPI00177CAEDA|nr:LOW QUALITY PROTEIN: uncharacterized protein C3orf38 homolog [Rhagoletis pomonella]
MPITDQEKLGIVDFLAKDEQNVPALLQVARSVTKNICDVATTQEALDYVYIQIGDTLTLLNKRAITREMLFKYLHQRKIQVNADFTKGALISRIIEYWNSKFEYNNDNSLPNTTTSITSLTNVTENNTATSITTNLSTSQQENETQYPIHLLARQFTQWFFNNLNKQTVKADDFWSDCQLQLRIAATDQINDYECTGADEVIFTLLGSKEQFGFYFNPNLTHAGVQGRMNVHGLVLVLACGTLHTEQNCVGVFECTFGLLRDPFAENNWKVKTMKCILRSQLAAVMPSLCESETLVEALHLPIPEGEIT